MKVWKIVSLLVLVTLFVFNSCDKDVGLGTEGSEEIISTHTIPVSVILSDWPTSPDFNARTITKIDRVKYLDEDGNQTDEEFRLYAIKSKTEVEVVLHVTSLSTFRTSDVDVSSQSNQLYQLRLGYDHGSGPVYEYVLSSFYDETLKEIKGYLDIE